MGMEPTRTQTSGVLVQPFGTYPKAMGTEFRRNTGSDVVIAFPSLAPSLNKAISNSTP